MKNLVQWPLLALVVGSLAACSNNPSAPMTYPETRTVDVVDTLWDTPVADPYRWLEDDRDEEVMAWVAAQASTASPRPFSSAAR